MFDEDGVNKILTFPKSKHCCALCLWDIRGCFGDRKYCGKGCLLFLPLDLDRFDERTPEGKAVHTLICALYRANKRFGDVDMALWKAKYILPKSGDK